MPHNSWEWRWHCFSEFLRLQTIRVRLGTFVLNSLVAFRQSMTLTTLLIKETTVSVLWMPLAIRRRPSLVHSMTPLRCTKRPRLRPTCLTAIVTTRRLSGDRCDSPLRRPLRGKSPPMLPTGAIFFKLGTAGRLPATGRIP